MYLQRHHDAGGFTDIEVDSLPAYALILEAKKGLQLPALAQLAKYAARLNDLPGARAILVVADVHEDVARYQGLPHEVLGITVGYMPWSAIVQMTAHCAKQAMPRGRHDLNELTEFLRWNVMTRDANSNRTFCVVLSRDRPVWSALSWYEFVYAKRVYFHDLSAGWPTHPPNYIAFRAGGELVSAHHVDDWKIVPDLSAEVDFIAGEHPSKPVGPHALYSLGPPMRPAQPVKNGGIWPNGRLWAMLDLLLTAPTIADAVRISTERQNA